MRVRVLIGAGLAAACAAVMVAVPVAVAVAQTPTPDYCSLFENYESYLKQSSALGPAKKREALESVRAAMAKRDGLRNRRDAVGMTKWCHETLLELRRKDGT